MGEILRSGAAQPAVEQGDVFKFYVHRIKSLCLEKPSALQPFAFIGLSGLQTTLRVSARPEPEVAKRANSGPGPDSSRSRSHTPKKLLRV